MVEDKAELIPLFPEFKCTDKFCRKWLFLVPEGVDVPPDNPTIVRALGEILSTPPLGLKQVEVWKIWFSPGRQIAYRFGSPNEPIKRYESKQVESFLVREAIVAELPKCDFCSAKAGYDGKTRDGSWAYMCEYHFRSYGIGLGLGKGQRLVEDRNQQPL